MDPQGHIVELLRRSFFCCQASRAVLFQTCIRQIRHFVFTSVASSRFICPLPLHCFQIFITVHLDFELMGS